MSKVLLCGPKDGLAGLSDLLHKLHRAHIVKARKAPAGFETGRPLAAATRASEQLVQLRALKSSLPALPAYTGPLLKTSEVQALLDGTLQDSEKKLLKKMEEREEIHRKFETVQDTLKALVPFAALQLNLEHYQPFDNLTAFVGTTAKDAEPELQAAGLNFELFRGDARAPQAIALFVEKAQAAAAGEVLAKAGFREERPLSPTVGLTDYQLARDGGHYTGAVATLVQALQQKAATMDAAIQALDRDITKLRETWAVSCLPAEEHLQIQVEKSELPFDVLVTGHAYMVEFWLPDTEVAEVKSELERTLGDSFHFEVVQRGAGEHGHGHAEAPAAEHAHAAAGDHGHAAHPDAAAHADHGHEEEIIPVKLNNPPYFSLFEMLTKMFSTPKYDELDPTIFLSIFFPIYFGLMVGDVGYGVLIAALGVLGFMAGKPGSDLRSIGMFLISGGLVAVGTGYFVFHDMFGIAFNSHGGGLEWSRIFGLEHFPGVGKTTPIHKLDSAGVNEFLVLSLIFGMVHMGLGFLLGSFNEVKHSVKHGIAKLGWFFVLQALGLVVLNLRMCRETGIGQFFWHTLSFLQEGAPGSEQMNLKIWGAMGGFGFLALLFTEPAGLVELLGPLSNTISYTRLAGIGVAKAALAVAMNQMILPLWDAGPVGMVACVVLLIVAHAMILGLGILSGAVQAMRLNFFEFFSKFMAGGGTDYAPFGRVRQYTVAE